MRVPIAIQSPLGGGPSSTASSSVTSPSTPTSSIAAGSPYPKTSIPELLKRYPVNLSKYEQFRAYLHSHPELSTFEKNTAAFVKVHISLLGCYEVHEGIGGYGVAAVLKNGEGRTVLLRADMDALPVKEQTGLPYASEVEMVDWDGKIKPVMHACGHDTHVTCLIGAAERLASMRDHWSGTVILVFQPDEERSGGAQRMVDDGLYDKVPIPDVLLGQHVGPQRAGRVGMVPGVQLCANDIIKITVHGIGGHASMPSRTVDPIIIMSSCILRLQTIVSREIDPASEFAVVTVSKITAGDAPNIIPDKAEFHIDMRTVDEAVRMRVLASIQRMIKAECEASGSPQEPTIEILFSHPVTYNSPKITQVIGHTFAQVFGEDFKPREFPRANASEDFPMLAASIGKPYCLWSFGGTDPELYDAADPQRIPANHSPFFAPVMQPTLGAGIDAMTAAALTFLS